MTFRVEYNHETSGLIPVDDAIELQETAQEVARKSVGLEGATFARVINNDTQGEVWSVKKLDDGSLLEV